MHKSSIKNLKVFFIFLGIYFIFGEFLSKWKEMPAHFFLTDPSSTNVWILEH